MKQKNKLNIANSLFILSFFTLLFSLFGLLNPVSVSAQTGTAELGGYCDDDAAIYCKNSLSCVNKACVNLDSDGGAVGQYCDDGSNIKCNAGLSCGDNNRCYDPNKTNGGSSGTGGSGSGGGSGGGSSGGGSTTMTCPEGLSNQNGLCLPKESAFPKTGLAGSTTLVELITKAIQFLLFFAGIIAVVFLVLGGYWYMASGGNDELAEKGKKTITNFVMGLVVIIMAYAIVTILFNTLTADTFTK